MEQHLTWARTDSDFAGTIPEGWGQGRATYGGLLAGVALRCLRQLSSDRAVREVSIGFIGPVAPGPASFTGERLREGRSASHLSGRMHQGGRVVLTAHVVLGEARSSRIQVDSPVAPTRPAPQDAAPFGYIEGLTPEFTQHFGYAWTDGDWPFSGSKTARVGGWCRFLSAQRMTEAHLLGLVDAWPAPVLPMIQGFAPASSMTWTLVRTSTPLHAEADAWCWYEADADHAQDGFAECRARLYRPDGQLLATSRQLVAVFA